MYSVIAYLSQTPHLIFKSDPIREIEFLPEPPSALLDAFGPSPCQPGDMFAVKVKGDVCGESALGLAEIRIGSVKSFKKFRIDLGESLDK